MLRKRFLSFIAATCLCVSAFADWSYGTAQFSGSQPSNSMSIGTVMVWYNGNLSCKGTRGNVHLWEGTGDICVVFPKNYNGPQMQFTSTGGMVQIQQN